MSSTLPSSLPCLCTECVNTFDAHDDKVWALTLSGASGDLLASGGGDGAIAVWEDCTAADADEAAAEAEAAVLKQQDLANALRVSGSNCEAQGCRSQRCHLPGGSAIGVLQHNWAHIQGCVHLLEAVCTARSPPNQTLLICPSSTILHLQEEDWARAARLAFEMRHPGRLLGVVRQALERGTQVGRVCWQTGLCNPRIGMLAARAMLCIASDACRKNSALYCFGCLQQEQCFVLLRALQRLLGVSNQTY